MLNSDGNNMSDSHKDYIMDNNVIKGHKNGLDLYNKILRVFPITDKELSQLLLKSGITGLIGNNGREYVIFNASTIDIVDRERVGK
jgi:hypothetical protein